MSRSFAYANYDAYRPGGAYFTCDRCSGRFRRADMFVEWDSLRVCKSDLDPRPPQMSPPNVYPEGIPFTDARPPQDRPDRLEDDTALQSGWGGFTIQNGLTYPPSAARTVRGQDQQPGALSPLPADESNNTLPQSGEPGNPGIGLPLGPNVLADDVTFISGPIPAPDNTNSTVPPQVPAPRP